MFKLLLKYIAGFIILGIISIIVLYVTATNLWQHSAEQMISMMNRGVALVLQQKLLQHPEQSWPAIIEKLHPSQANEISVVSISTIKLPHKKMQQLRRGEFVIHTPTSIFYFGYGVSPASSYQRIANSNYVLKMQEIPLVVVASRVSAWMNHLISLDLKQTPRLQWPQALRRLEKIYAVPLAVMSITDSSLPATIKTELMHDDFAMAKPDHNGQVKYSYFKIDQNDTLLRIGPIFYPLYPQYQPYILIAIFIILAIVFIILMTYLFSKNLDKIYQMTIRYSQADFSGAAAFSQHSTLRMLYNNIVQMGEKIHYLIQNQRNLTRFVAHECRIPATTILFAIEKLKKEKLSTDAKTHLQSIKTDIADLNALITNCLNYARYSDQNLQLHYSNINMNSWLQACVDKYQSAPKKITLHTLTDENLMVCWDTHLMKHVIHNLLNNALKYARHQIQLSSRINHGIVIIQIDDDGMTIDPADKEHIFTPFVRLKNDSQSADKGFGLGLYIAQTVIKRHQGNIQVSDSWLGGTCLVIHLPISVNTQSLND